MKDVRASDADAWLWAADFLALALEPARKRAGRRR